MYKDVASIDDSILGLGAIRNSIKNILLTPRGSVPGKPRFGSDLFRTVFQPLDTLTESIAKNYVLEALTEYETRITVKEIQIKRVEEYNKIVVDIYFSYKDSFSENEVVSAKTSISMEV